MPLVDMATILADAEKKKYAVGAFNCNNMEIVQAIIAAATKENAPVVIQASQGAIKYAGIEYIVEMTTLAAEQSHVPVALHLDHGTSFEQCALCVRKGFTSVMIDASQRSLADNIDVTQRVLEFCRATGVSVEAELGKIGGTEDDITVADADAIYTDPNEAKEFIDACPIDALAVAIGTAHGQYKGEPKLDLDRLVKIKEKIDMPIVLHGSSGVPDAALKAAVERGVRKINIDTNVREAFVKAAREVLNANPKEIDPRKILGPAREAMTELVREKIRLFGSANKA